jgi:hypothetical protein
VAKRGKKIALKPGVRHTRKRAAKRAAVQKASPAASIAFEGFTRRSERVRTLMRLEFPYSWAPPPPADLPSTTSPAPSGSRGDHESWTRDEAKRKQRHSELLTMSQAQFDATFNDAWARWLMVDRARREKLTPAVVAPEWQFWAREDEWALYDAALLLATVEPRQALGLLLKDMANGRKTAKFSMQVLPVSRQTSAAVGQHRQTHGGFIPEDLSDEAKSKLEAIEEIARRALVASQKDKLTIENGAVKPREFLAWARGKGYEIPAAFASLTSQQQQSASESNTRHSIQKATIEAARKKRNKNIARDQRIHDLKAQGKSRKEISREANGLSESQIGRVLARVRPQENE